MVHINCKYTTSLVSKKFILCYIEGDGWPVSSFVTDELLEVEIENVFGCQSAVELWPRYVQVGGNEPQQEVKTENQSWREGMLEWHLKSKLLCNTCTFCLQPLFPPSSAYKINRLSFSLSFSPGWRVTLVPLVSFWTGSLSLRRTDRLQLWTMLQVT